VAGNGVAEGETGGSLGRRVGDCAGATADDELQAVIERIRIARRAVYFRVLRGTLFIEWILSKSRLRLAHVGAEWRMRGMLNVEC